MNIRESVNNEETQNMDETDSTIAHWVIPYMWKHYPDMIIKCNKCGNKQ